MIYVRHYSRNIAIDFGGFRLPWWFMMEPCGHMGDHNEDCDKCLRRICGEKK